jgi:predicted 3-demethylubiquinone-9 3-methyltransferase (glyoxalase superfamily)
MWIQHPEPTGSGEQRPTQICNIKRDIPQPFVGLNGGPHFKFNEAVSFQIPVDTQAEVDRLTDALSAVPEAEQCGWVKDRFGLSWQIVPRRLTRLLSDPDPARAGRAFEAMMQMKRIDIAALERAADRHD